MSKLDWMQTYTGEHFSFTNIESNNICIQDIAHSLSLICRFNGHCQEFYSVAQHSIHVADMCAGITQLHGLLHDAAEAYTNDIVRGLKNKLFINMEGFKSWETVVLNHIYSSLDIPLPNSQELTAIKAIDNIILATEARDLFDPPPTPDWDIADLDPLTTTITPVPSIRAEKYFLEMYYDLIATYLDRPMREAP